MLKLTGIEERDAPAAGLVVGVVYIETTLEAQSGASCAHLRERLFDRVLSCFCVSGS